MINLKEILNRDLTSADIERKGKRSHKLGKWFMAIGLFGISLLLLISIVVVILYNSRVLNDVLRFEVGSGSALVDFVVCILLIVSYIAIPCGIVGVPLYFYGINTFALGRIAANSEKE